MAPRGGRSRKVGLKRIDAAIDALKPMGFSPEIIRQNVNKLLKEYGEEGWAFIEDGYYKLLIEFTLDEEDKKMSCEQGESSLREDLKESPNEDGLQGSEEDEPEEAGPSGEAIELLCINHGTVIATPTADNTLASPDPVVVCKPTLSPTESATSPSKIAMPIEVNQTNELLMDQESILPFHSIYALPVPPGFEHIHQEKVAPSKRRPSLGWIGPKDDDDFSLLTPAPVLSWRAGERQRKRKSQWDVEPDVV